MEIDSGVLSELTDAGLEFIGWSGEIMTVPCAATGGITVENGLPLLEARAGFRAVVAGRWSYPKDPVKAVADFNAAPRTLHFALDFSQTANKLE